MLISDLKIKNILRESINSVLKERVSSVIYHFTFIGNLWEILKEDRIYLSSALETRSDDSRKMKKFFLSLTRQRSGEMGYSSKCNVRIVFDGDMLNSDFEGGAFDY
jgi:hypothetical protein